MAYKTSISNSIGFFNSESKTQQSLPENIYARVISVVLDESHPDYEAFGKIEAINGIRYKLLNEKVEQEDTDLPFAYCSEVGLKRIPLVGEIVEIFSNPQNSANKLTYTNRTYYTNPINLWNNAHHNALPDITSNETEVNLGTGVVERDDIGTLQPFPGDVYLEGRTGQSLRFTSFSHPKNPYINDNNNGSPLCILRIGQKDEVDIFENYVEDINSDPSSIYITSNHTIPLELSSQKQDSYRDEIPTSSETHQGSQIIINSGRVLLHAKNDHLLLNSRNSIGLSGNTVNIDGSNYITFDSPKIYLGNSAQEPVLKGDTTVKLLEDILNALTSLVTTHSLATPTTAHVQLIAASQGILPKLQSFQSRLQSLKSKKVLVE